MAFLQCVTREEDDGTQSATRRTLLIPVAVFERAVLVAKRGVGLDECHIDRMRRRHKHMLALDPR